MPEEVRPAVREAEHRPPSISRLRLYLLLGLMVLLWSGNFVGGKLALHEFLILTLGGLRIVLAAFFLVTYFVARRGVAGFQVLRREWKLLGLLALFGIVFNQLFFIAGLKYTSVAHSSLIICLSPGFVLIIARLRGLEQFTALKIAGLAISMAGVAVLAGEQQPGRGPTLLGDLLTLTAALAFACYVVLGKEITPRFDSLSLTTFIYALGALIFLPITVGSLLADGLPAASGTAWLAVGYMVVCGSVGSYLIFYYALRFISATHMAALAYLQPVIAILLGLALLGEQVTGHLLVGAAVVFLGVYLTEKG